MANAREIRLQSDYEHLKALAENSGGTLEIESVRGRPPDQYVLVFHCRSIERLQDGRPIYREKHPVRIQLPARYPAPSAPPKVELLAPLFHPHVYPNLTVCMGSWQTSEFLDEFVLRLGAMIQYDRRCLNIRDPANEAAVSWAHKHLHLFPTDTRAFQNDDPERPAPDEFVPVDWVDLMDTQPQP